MKERRATEMFVENLGRFVRGEALVNEVASDALVVTKLTEWPGRAERAG